MLTADVHHATLHDLFERQVRCNPHKIALVDGDMALTYQELDARSNQLAHELAHYQIEPNDAVGILLEKCYEYIIAALAILKAGGAYLHLELAYPSQFLGEIFVDAAPKVVVSKRKHQDKLAAHDVCVLYVDDGVWKRQTTAAISADASNENIAIIGYSSGSTGKPKGVLVSHRACIYTYDMFWREVWELGSDRFAYTTFMTWDAVSPLVVGQTGYMIADDVSYDPQRLLDTIAQHQINHTVFTPSLLTTILQTVDAATIREKLQSLNVIWVGGEVTTQPLVDETLRLLPDVTLINNYGPTECFVITQGKLRAHDPLTPTVCSVGRVLDGMGVLLLDDEMQPVADGEVGELYATGPCLADGYLNLPELTRRKFVSIDGMRYYRTGDSVRFLADGRLIVLGRRDATVKLRSYNVNMLAIEETLRAHPAVDEAIVSAVGAEGEDKYLVAYLLRGEGATWQIEPQVHTCSELATYLEDYLPFYMIPRTYIELEELPLHPISGKLDKSGLPVPTLKRLADQTLEPLAPDATPAQQTHLLTTLLIQLLSLPSVQTTDDFFEIGLHSLLAAQLAGRIRQLCGVDLSVATLYEHSTVERLVAHLNNEGESAEIAWEQDAILEAEIVPAGRVSSAENIFLTGATGYLGAYLLAELLHQFPERHVFCLVRTENRIIPQLKEYGLWDATFDGRIVPLVGDLEEPRFGWSWRLFAERAQQVGLVFHAAAWVNMAHPYKRLKAANVGGTREVLRFATCSVDKPLHYVSTLGVLPVGNASTYPENGAIDGLIGRLHNGYTQTKWVAEKLVWQAIERGIPTHIYRLGNIGPDSQRLCANPNDTVMLFLKTCRQMRLAPCQPDWSFEYTPADIVAKAIVQSALCQTPINDVFHVASQRLIPAMNVFCAFQEADLIDQIVEMDEWVAAMREYAAYSADPRQALLEQSLKVEETFLLEDEPFDTRCFVAQMQRCHVSLPDFSVQYLIRATSPSENAETLHLQSEGWGKKES